ncbi:hypothetical protein BLA29_012905, partial [Euroglyphus maynei]
SIFLQTGFIKIQQTNECEDIDECEQRLSHCPSTMRCVNTIGSFECIHHDHQQQQQTSIRRKNFRKKPKNDCIVRKFFGNNVENKCVDEKKEKDAASFELNKFSKPKISDQIIDSNNGQFDGNEIRNSDQHHD